VSHHVPVLASPQREPPSSSSSSSRQHPGETQGSFYCEGLLRRLLGVGSDSSVGAVDGLAMRLLQQYTFHIVPLMCPDGAVMGHLRTNACGANLNREWANSDAAYSAPSTERSPEVLCVLRAMHSSGCDAFVDVHGDEVRPFAFLSGSEGMPVWGPRLQALHGAFLAAYARANPDIQAEIGYDADPAGEGDARIASNQVAVRFNCMSVTLEMPYVPHKRLPPLFFCNNLSRYKDNASNPDASRGWSSDRCALLGASLVDALSYVQPYLRHSGSFWESLPACDAYVAPRDIDGLPTHELNS
jgi:murein tripeptide amidase MpaA